MGQKTTIDELQVLITANAASFNKQLVAVQQQLNGLSKNADTSSKPLVNSMSAMKLAAIAAATAMSVAIGKMVASSTRAFGDFEQNVGGTKAIFGDYAGFVQKKAWEASRTMGMSANEYMQNINKIGAIMQGSGLSQAQSLKMASEWMQRAADQASVMGVSTSEAMMAITGAAKGNFTMMDNIGVKMSATTLEAYALSRGINTTFESMSEAQKIGLAYELFLERTGYAAGNFAKEGATTLNGALATLKASFGNLSSVMGQAFAPVVMQVANFVSSYLIPAIQAVIPYVIAFMQVIGQAVSYVGGLLGGIFGGGGEAIASVGESASQATQNVNNLGGAVGGVGKALGGATKAAKKLKGQLAGFDEMTVIKSPQSSDEGGGGGVGGGGGAMPKFDLPKNAMSGLKKFGDEADAIAERVKKAFGSIFGDIDFTPLKNSLALLGEALAPFAKGAFKGLEWLWNEILKPLGKFTIEKVLPVFFELLASAFKLLEPLLDGVGKGLKFIWDNFLKPAATFVGDVIITVIKAFSDFFKVVSENETVKDTLMVVGVAIGVIAGAWIALNAALAVFSVVGAIAGGIFAFITSPITLVVGAILLMVGAVVLAVKHWDDICKFVGEVAGKIAGFVGNMASEVGKFFAGIWEGIVKVFKGVGEWFGKRFEEAGEAIKKAFDTIVGFFSGIWNDICKVFEAVGKWFGDRFNEAKEAMHKAFSAIGKWASDRWNDIVNGFNKAKEWFSNVFKGAYENIGKAFSGVGQWAEDRWKDITKAFDNAWNVFSDIGKNIWEGLKNGIGNLANNIKNMFTGAVDSVKKFLGIHSPSKLFAGIGKYIDSGLVLGITSDISKVDEAMQRLSAGFTVPSAESIISDSLNMDIIGKNDLKTPDWANRLIQAIENNSDKHITITVDGARLGEITAKSINDLAFLRNANIVDF